MAKSKGPLLSEKASGTIGSGLTFSLRESGQQVRYQKKQKDKITQKRSSVRSVYHDAFVAWNALTTEEKESYNELAQSKHYTGYNYFIKEYMLSHYLVASYLQLQQSGLLLLQDGGKIKLQ